MFTFRIAVLCMVVVTLRITLITNMLFWGTVGHVEMHSESSSPTQLILANG